MARIEQRPVNKLELQISGSIVFVSRMVLVLVVLATGLLSSASAQEFEQSRRAARLARQFNTDVERARIWAEGQAEEAEANFAADVGSLLDTYLEELQTIQEAETTAGRLDAAIEVRDAIAEITSSRDALTQLSGEVSEAEPEPNLAAEARQLSRLQQRELDRRLAAVAGQVWRFNLDTWVFSEDGLVINNETAPALIPYEAGFLVKHNNNTILYIEFNADLTAATRYRSHDTARGERVER